MRRTLLCGAWLAATMADGHGAAMDTDWRMVFAGDIAVVVVNAETFRRDDAMRAFQMVLYFPKADENGVIGISGDLRLDCANHLREATGMRDIQPDGTTSPAKDAETGFIKIKPNTFGGVLQERMCEIKGQGSEMDGVFVQVSPYLAARSVFALLKLGLSSKQAAELATYRYQDAAAMATALGTAKVAASKLPAVRKVLSGQLVPAPKPPPPIIPLPAAVASGRVGRYAHSEHELVSGIWLKADGTFQYGLTVGSLDETAKGRWTANGSRIHLVNEPKPVPPAITPGPAQRDADAALSLRVVVPNGRGVPGMDFVVGFDAGDPAEGYTQADGWTLPAEEKRTPRWVEFSMESYGLRSPRFSIDRDSANVLTFILAPNDIGVVDFTGMVVDADKDGLVIHRGGTVMRFRKAND